MGGFHPGHLHPGGSVSRGSAYGESESIGVSIQGSEKTPLLWDMVNERVVCILLECIFVSLVFLLNF